MNTALWILLAFAAGVTVGFVLCSALIVSHEEQRKSARLPLPPAPHPLDSDSII